MKNKFLSVFIAIIFFQPVLAENLNIQSSEISIDKKSRLTVLKGNVIATDPKNNIFKTEYAEYNKDLKFLKSKGKTTILTSEGYLLTGTEIEFDNKNKYIKSNEKATIKDLENTFKVKRSLLFLKSKRNHKLEINIIKGNIFIIKLGINNAVRVIGINNVSPKFLKNSISSNKFKIKPKQ